MHGSTGSVCRCNYCENSGDRNISALVETLKHSYPPIRGHSAWALGKIGGQSGRML